MGFQKVVFPISADLKSQWNTEGNGDLFEGNALSLIVEPGEYVPEWDERSRPVKGATTWYAKKKTTDHARFTLTLKECREAVFRILQTLESESNTATPPDLVICYDYAFPDRADTETGYSTRQGLLVAVSVGSGLMADEEGTRYFLGVSVEYEIYRY